ncbi:MAG TPA: class I SAM-dependent methyltransferase [Chitinophagales bacterium]|nr:class I SAM-dependent methyltransferase [Chitinophagales bacterium]
MNSDIKTYYNQRAKEYEKVYHNPDEQDDLKTAVDYFQHLFLDKTVLEIACGTGYWTERIAKTATSVFATDINKSVVEIALRRQTKNNVRFNVADMYHLNTDMKYQGIFGGFIWSHILLQDLDRFLLKLKDLLTEDEILVFIDSNPVDDTIHDKKRVSHTDEHGNTYQTRMLEDGTSHLVLKNFPTKEFLLNKLSVIATDINYIQLEYYWIVSCSLKV